MKKVFVLVPYMGRTDEEIQAIREETLQLYKDRTLDDDAELSIPHGKRLTGDIEAMFAADVVVVVKYHIADPVCSIVAQAAHTYGKAVVEDRDIEQVMIPHEEPVEEQEEESNGA